MISAEPETHTQVCLHGTLIVTGRDTAVPAWSDIADPSRLAKAYRDVGGRMPVAVVIGGDPAVQFAAAAPLPSAVDPLGLAGLLRDKPLDAVACRSVDLLVPAESDFIIEGWIDPIECSGRHHSIARVRGLPLNVTAVTHRANRVFPGVVRGIGNNETLHSGSDFGTIVSSLFETATPGVGRPQPASFRRCSGSCGSIDQKIVSHSGAACRHSGLGNEAIPAYAVTGRG